MSDNSELADSPHPEAGRVLVAGIGRSDGGRTEPAAARLRVLVVDDNVDAAESMAMYLELMGNELRTVHSGREALEAAPRFRPDVVFLDIGLPAMDGYEVARRLRADPDLRAATLVALTGWGSDEDQRRSKDAGFDYHLTKPAEAALVERLLAEVKAKRSRPPT